MTSKVKVVKTKALPIMVYIQSLVKLHALDQKLEMKSVKPCRHTYIITDIQHTYRRSYP